MRLSTIAITIVAALAAAQASARGVGISSDPYRIYATATAGSLEKSKSPRDWALASQLLGTDNDGHYATHERAALLRKAVQAAPTDHLVQWMWAHAVVQASDCGTPSECADRSAALARLEPDNAAAWLPVLDRAMDAKDTVAENDALTHMAAAKRFDEHLDAAATAWLDVYERFPPPSLAGLFKDVPHPSETGSRAELALGEVDEAAATSRPQGLFASCNHFRNPKAPAAHFANCAQAGRLMMEQAPYLTGRWFGFMVLRISGDAKPADLPAIREIAWQYEQFYKPWLKPQRFLDEAGQRALLANLASSGSDKAQVTNRLHRDGLPSTPPPTWQWKSGKPDEMLHAPPQ